MSLLISAAREVGSLAGEQGGEVRGHGGGEGDFADALERAGDFNAEQGGGLRGGLERASLAGLRGAGW